MSGSSTPMRNGPHGYGVVTKTLHWLVAIVIVAQFLVGYLLDADEHGRGRGRGRGGEPGRGRGRGGGYEAFGDNALLTVHVVLGVTILALVTLRLAWRLTTPLPPWAPQLSPVERRIATWTERALYAVLFAIPITGLVLVLGDDDDLLALHVAAHLAFFAAIAVHLGLVLKHQVVDRDHLVRRMLPGRRT